MKTRIRHILAFTLVAVLALTLALLPLETALATKYGDVSGLPSGYWTVQEPYGEAVGANNKAGIIEHGEKLLNFWFQGKTAQECATEWQKNVLDHGYEINQIWSASRLIAEAYESRNEFSEAIRVYKIALAFVDPYIALILNEPKLQGNVDDMEFARQEIQAKLTAYEVDIALYAEINAKDGTGDTSYVGAKHEPKTGIYYGDLPNPHAIPELSQKSSSVIIYVAYETEKMSLRVENDLTENEKLGYDRNSYSVIEVAWNFTNEGEMLKTVPNDSAKVTEAAQYFNELGLPILLRVGAEMNIWQRRADPAEFIAAFRFIADIMHKQAPNVAMVWSVNSDSAQGLTFDMFYPGAEYVDWVGISLYTRKYFNSNPNTTDSDAAIWGVGKFANPIRYIDDLVKQYGSRHPIMIAEGAVSLQNKSNSEDITQWALPRIRQTYAYIPMLYPQVKLMIWFNRDDLDSRDRFGLTNNATARNLYGQLTSSGYFINNGMTEPKITYKKLGTATLPSNAVTLLTYAPYFTMDDISVQYRLDGKWIGQSDLIPYRSALDISGEANGEHKLTVQVLSGGTLLKTAEYNVYKNGDTTTVSTGAITPPSTETPPSVETPPKADPSSWKVFIDGKPVVVEAYSINDANYLKLRDMAISLNGTAKQFEVGFVDGVVTIESGKPYTPNGTEGNTAEMSKTTSGRGDPILKDGQNAEVDAYKIDGSNYYGLRAMMRLLDVGLDFDGAKREIYVDTTQPYKD